MLNKRKYLFDLNLISRYRQEIFGITILWIMLLHGTIMDKVVFPEACEPLYIILKHGNVGVDVFLFLSGLGLYYSCRRSDDSQQKRDPCIPIYLSSCCLCVRRFDSFYKNEENRECY